MKWNKGANQGIVVAGREGKGSALTQLYYPNGLFVDTSSTIYVADSNNDRVIRWPKGAQQGTVIVGGNGEGDAPNQLNCPVALSSIVIVIYTSSIVIIIVFNASIFSRHRHFLFTFVLHCNLFVFFLIQFANK